MAIISEDFVSFETAKLLKEKGFDEKSTSYYQLNSFGEPVLLFDTKQFHNRQKNRYCRCTLQMAMKWLRERHKISIEITSTGYLVDNDVEWECDIKAGHRLYFKHITNEKSFESCAEAALKYTLENLI